jgi:hypothetical protein
MYIGSTRVIKGIACHTNATVAVAQSIAFHAFKMLVQDVRDMVYFSANTSIKRSLRSIDEGESEHGSIRKQALGAWLKCANPLSWSPPGGPQNATYRQLIVILNEDAKNQPRALRETTDKVAYDQLATRLYNMGKAETATPIIAPVHRKGAFVHALPVAIQMILRKAPSVDTAVQFTIGIMESMLRKMEIQFLPWHHPGGRAYIVQHDIWLIIQRRPPRINTAISDDTIDENPTAALATSTANMNATAPWVLPELLYTMGVLWDKKVLPEEWTLDAASVKSTDLTAGGEYIRKTYEYVRSNYDGNIWWHHMALVWAILFSMITPYVFAEKSTVLLGRDEKELTAAARRIPWVTPSTSKHKGVTDRGPYIPMVSATIFALLDKKSPLSIYMAQNSNSFGKPWTSKHGM